MFDRGSVRQLVVHNNAKTDMRSSYFMGAGKTVTLAATSEQVFDCRGRRIEYQAAAKFTATFEGSKSSQLKFRWADEIWTLKRASQKEVDRIMALPKCSKLAK